LQLSRRAEKMRRECRWRNSPRLCYPIFQIEHHTKLLIWSSSSHHLLHHTCSTKVCNPISLIYWHVLLEGSKHKVSRDDQVEEKRTPDEKLQSAFLIAAKSGRRLFTTPSSSPWCLPWDSPCLMLELLTADQSISLDLYWRWRVPFQGVTNWAPKESYLNECVIVASTEQSTAALESRAKFSFLKHVSFSTEYLLFLLMEILPVA